MKPLVETDWLDKNLNNVKIFDATWHLPNQKKIAAEEFKKKHIKGSMFFDIDEHSDKDSNLPHMMPKGYQWKKVISNFGVSNDDHVIVYDNSDVYSSCRLWFSFLYFGHNPNLVSVLNGGMKKWLAEERSLVTETKAPRESDYNVKELKNLIVNKELIDRNIERKTFDLVDARNSERFLGKVQEPRKGLNSGSIPNSINLHYKKCLKEDNTFKDINDLKKIFSSMNLGNNLVFTCGSGVTATIIGLVYSIIYGKRPVIYDGSWSEYGLKK